MFNKMGFSFYKRVSFVKETTMVENSKELHCKRKSKFVLSRMAKRAEVGETVTWAVATVAIVIILVISVFVSSTYFNENKKASPLTSGDYLAASSFNSWLLTKDSSGKMIYEQIKSEGDFNGYNGNLSIDIFKRFYEKDYIYVWLGINSKGPSLLIRNNNYFGNIPTEIRGGDITKRHIKNVIEDVDLGEEKVIEMALVPKT
ncbi:MAG: hypothetical protein KJ905_01665 [Nanoarchaeota archaeon]|nr:hypothetical protein [Nanoarchaeota archaeon]MBU1501461.1 hypothetical protein [Nanoarchaeota archaeon]MBU2459347.1 hypothetical protein [Nanoarchaeota archaeon]